MRRIEAVTATPAADADRSERRIRLLWLIKGLGRGGAELLLLHAARVWDRDRFDVEVAYLLPWKDALVNDFREAGTPVHLLSTRSEFDLRWAVALRKLVRRGRYDVVHIHSPYVAAVARPVLRAMRSRPWIVGTEHNIWSGYPLATRIAHRLTFPLDDRNLAVSEAVKNSVPRRWRGRIRPLIHGIPLEAVRRGRDGAGSVRNELGVGPDEILVGTVANFRSQKAYPLLLAAARELLDRDLPVRFVAVGAGPQEQTIRDLHRDLDLGNRFLLLGSREDAQRIVAALDIFVLASHYEGLPLVVMEALSLGVPVVATAVGGVPELVSDREEGILVAPGRPDLLADAVAELIHDPDLRARIGTAAAAASDRFDHRRAVRAMESMYAELAASR